MQIREYIGGEAFAAYIFSVQILHNIEIRNENEGVRGRAQII